MVVVVIVVLYADEFWDLVVLVVGHKFVTCIKFFSKLKHSNKAPPTELRRVIIDDTIVHLF